MGELFIFHPTNTIGDCGEFANIIPIGCPYNCCESILLTLLTYL